MNFEQEFILSEPYSLIQEKFFGTLEQATVRAAEIAWENKNHIGIYVGKRKVRDLSFFDALKMHSQFQQYLALDKKFKQYRGYFEELIDD